MRKYFVFLVIYILILTSYGLYASIDDLFADEAFFKVEEEMASVASRYAQRVDQTPAMITVVTDDQIKNMGAENLPDILKSVPGVEVHRTMGGYYNIAFRGIRGTANILFMIDGHRVNSFYDGVSMYNITSENIARIEVIRGPGSSMHGTNAFVGVINVITKQYKDGSTATVAADRNNGVRTSFGYGTDYNDYNVSLFGEIFKTQGADVTYIRDRSGQSGSMDDEKQIGNFNLSVTDEEGFVFSTKFLQERRGAYLGENYFADDAQYYNQDMLIFDYSKTYEVSDQSQFVTKLYTDISEVNKMISMGSNSRTDLGSIDGFAKIDYKSQAMGAELQFFHNFSEKARIVSGMLYETMRLYDYSMQTNFRLSRTDQGMNTLTDANDLNLPFSDYHTEWTQSIGTERPFDGATDAYRPYGDYSQNNNRQIMGFFLQGEYNHSRNFGITLGGRFDKYSDFGNTFNPKLGIVSNPIDPLVIKFAYATAFRAPTFQELYDRTQIGVKNGVFGSPTLDPETIETIELGVEYKFTDQLRLGMNVYSNDIEDNIFPNNSSKTDGANFKSSVDDPGDFYENINGIKIKGLETVFRYDLDKMNYFHLNYSWFEQENLGGFRPESQQPYVTDYKSKITSQPQTRMNAQLNFDIAGLSNYLNSLEDIDRVLSRGLSFNVKYHYGSERYNDVLDLTSQNRSYSNGDGRRWKIPAYNVFDFTVRTTEFLWENNSIAFSVSNLTNEDLYDDYPDVVPFTSGDENYTDNLIMPLPGRTFFVKVVSKF
jgi:outer membrane receptor for ferrienterochelin and colicin